MNINIKMSSYYSFLERINVKMFLPEVFVQDILSKDAIYYSVLLYYLFLYVLFQNKVNKTKFIQFLFEFGFFFLAILI